MFVSALALEQIAEKIMNEGPISLTEAAKLLPRARGGTKVHTRTVHRWVISGRHGVRLEAVRITGRGWWTSKPAVMRFIAGVSAGEMNQVDAHEVWQESERKERAARAKAELADLIASPNPTVDVNKHARKN